jgi:hypothetical protein
MQLDGHGTTTAVLKLDAQKNVRSILSNYKRGQTLVLYTGYSL